LRVATVSPSASTMPTEAADSAKEAADVDKARRACKDFEAILLCHLLSSMRSAFQSEEEADSGFGGDIFRSLMDEQFSMALARGGGIGLASMLEKGLGIDDMAAGIDAEAASQGIAAGAISAAKSAKLISGQGGRAVRSDPSAHRRDPSRPEGQAASGQLGNKNTPASAQAAGAAAETTPERTISVPVDISDPNAATSALARIRRFEPTIKAAATVFGLSSELIKAVIVQESGGNPRAVSGKGAKGLMQLTDGTARDLGVTNPFDPVQNIFGGARFLASLLKKFGGDLELALASYNAGLGAVVKYGGVPPFKETQDYVKRIVASLGEQAGLGGKRG
jgi:soluble lytic murein transglycosylase-like protein